MKFVNQVTYKPKKGRAIVGKSLTQLAEYQPLHKMLANLTIAGLNSAAKQALEFYDSNDPNAVEIPLLPRHITPDITEVHQVAQVFAQRKAEIESRVRAARAAENDRQIKLREQQRQAAQQPPVVPK